jgi:hypothetical protein
MENEEQQSESLAAGFNKVRGVEPPTEETVAEVTPPVEVPPVVETPPVVQPEEPVIAGLTESQLKGLLAEVPELRKFRDDANATFQKIHGKLGELNRPRASFGEFKRLAVDYPDLAAALKEDLAEGGSASGIKPEQIEEIVQARLTPALEETKAQLEETRAQLYQMSAIAAVEKKHPDRLELKATPDYTLWLESKPEKFRKEFLGAWEPDTVIAGLDDFKEWRKKAATAAESTERKKSRLEAAVVAPSGTHQAHQSKLPDSAGLSIGFRRIRGLA